MQKSMSLTYEPALEQAPESDGSGALRVMRAALAMGGLTPSQVSFLLPLSREHGTYKTIKDLGLQLKVLKTF